MVENSTNGSLRPFSFENILDELPELKNAGYQIGSYSFDPLLDSANINPDVWIIHNGIIIKDAIGIPIIIEAYSIRAGICDTSPPL